MESREEGLVAFRNAVGVDSLLNLPKVLYHTYK